MKSYPWMAAAALAISAFASSGDRSLVFQDCLASCEHDVCRTFSYSPSFSLRITRWTCQDDCKYACMHAVTDREIGGGEAVQQYYGKWPFYRFAGMQEPASVVFSLLNLWFHVEGMQKLQKIPDGHPMKPYYITWSIVSINAWTWSAVFHARGS
jgi:post-GPI attachment to proteins factor 3